MMESDANKLCLDGEMQSGSDPLQVVSLHVGGEEFGIDIQRVQEIIRAQSLTRVPNSPDFIAGVMNLRGRIIPVMGLRRRFGLEPVPTDKQTRIVVVEAKESVMGIMVDAVSEVLRIPTNRIEPPPIRGKVQEEYVSGVGKLDERLLILLNVERLMTDSDTGSTAGAQAETAAK